ncbi:hypothetical protein SFR_0989 [Streptomyces sp. FR-008]|nr:hypothetical protein SFR_0989 [Streptomyces sp. FR-008]
MTAGRTRTTDLPRPRAREVRCASFRTPVVPAHLDANGSGNPVRTRN